ncbi:amidase [Salipiger sp. PrR002]|uniref:amidase n=1 Tax=Salipiger sp. PrR002 TaxID=2706489 RepID=UPI0013B6B84B|nr:amidase [Salipiger sp. PrR002]NDV98574.1 amidase [Salipiger sp. PrR002]NDW57409.1 amidase [Salipiger sp. PrR004]
MTDLFRLDATSARALMRDGRLTPRDLTRACLARIAERDGEISAWLSLNPRAEAEASVVAASDPRPLAGIPVGIKDVIDTADLPTTHNSPLYSTRRPSDDAPCVELLRAAGAIILGKTDTTEFAAAGRNAVTGCPADPSRTAGGSSAGSAAAVADFHVPLALGTQTGGSTIRPAAFCGVPAMKPSWGLISAEGVKLYAASLDTVGLYARSYADLDLLGEVYGFPGGDAPPARPRLALCRTPYADELAPEMLALLEALPERLAPLADVDWLDLPEVMADLDALHRCVLLSEGAAAFRNLRHRGPLVHDDFIARADRREGHSARQMFEAYDRLADHRRAFETLAAPYDAVIAPSAPGFAPPGRTPGNPKFNALWTAMQLPCIHVPVSADPLPLGVQLVAARAQDRRLIRLAAQIAPAMALSRPAVMERKDD